MHPKRTTCPTCGTTFPRKTSGGKPNRFCSRACAYSRTPEDRFWERVNKSGPVPEACSERGPCWIWLGSLFADSGYGQFWLDGLNRRAHIVSYEWANGPTNGAQVQHLCNVRVCVRPTHLTLGTPAENTAYAVKHGRMASGERHWLQKGPDTRQHARGTRNGAAKLTEADIREIRRLAAEGVPQRTLAGRLGVTETAISDVVRRRTWKHVT